MVKTRFSKVPARSLGLIMLGCAVLIVSFPSRSTKAVLPNRAKAQSTVSPTPVPTPEPKRRNSVRRFFSWVGDVVSRPFRRRQVPVINDPPPVYLKASKSLITFCPFDMTMEKEDSCSPGREVELSASVGEEDKASFVYLWKVTAGRLSGEGRKVTWDLSGVAEGAYTAIVEWNDGTGLTAADSTTVTIAHCSGCYRAVVPCPTVSVSCPSKVDSKQSIIFVASVAGGDPKVKLTYTWSVIAGKIISGQGTSKITVDASNAGQQSITATVTVGGDLNPLCPGNTASCSVIDAMESRH